MGKIGSSSVWKGVAIGATALAGLAAAAAIGVLIWSIVTAYPITIKVIGMPGDSAYIVLLSKEVSRPAKLEIRELPEGGEERLLAEKAVLPGGGTRFLVPTFVRASKQVAVLKETESGKILGLTRINLLRT